jgi:hypothetical protein
LPGFTTIIREGPQIHASIRRTPCPWVS